MRHSKPRIQSYQRRAPRPTGTGGIVAAVALVWLLNLALIGGGIFIALHFIVKYW